MNSDTSRTAKHPNAVDAARHICQEARIVLTSLRGGPPNVARGELATDLMDLRSIVKAVLSEFVSNANSNNPHQNVFKESQSVDESVPFHRVHEPPQQPLMPTTSVGPLTSPSPNKSRPNALLDDGLGDGTVFVDPPAQPGQEPSMSSPTSQKSFQASPAEFLSPLENWALDVGPFARPFLAVIVDPRAAGPHTLVALRSLFRLVEQGSLSQVAAPGHTSATASSCNPHPYTVVFESLTKGVLSCKFEQTDAGADEAVEMAIADLLSLLVKQSQHSIRPQTLMDSFSTIFETRNTFVHSPALCYHFEDVLTAVVSTVFSNFHSSATLILEFLVNKLLHTPLVGGDGIDEALREDQMVHAATRLLCLRLVNCALRTGWDNVTHGSGASDNNVTENSAPANSEQDRVNRSLDESELLRIIKDDLCLSLLMTGQAIWAYHDASSNISPGLISLDVLSEICNTLSTLWHTIPLRRHLVAQFETIFTGFYQRALALLRKRAHPIDSITFNADLVFDAEVEVILESLVDLLCLHDFRHSIADGDGGSLESLFATYDCHLNRSDVATGLMVELCRCCGGSVNEEGEAVAATPASTVAGTPAPTASSGQSTPLSRSSSVGDVTSQAIAEAWRPVPPHLKELCAQALMGAMKCLFRDDKASGETLVQRSQREKTIMLSGEALQQDQCNPETTQETDASVDNDHFLRNIKSKKRLMRKGAMLFNQKASRGIEFLVSAGLFADPPTPPMVAQFLRGGLVVGLKKQAVGAYLGEAGKPRVAGSSPPDWERDWFHKEVLATYCSLFRFEGQSLLDGLRMFLSSFRLPGEAQQIDRILQAFSDTCGAVCDESIKGSSKLFSSDQKRASDAAYLLSFSIIMLNTDLHNANIREDRKMKLEDFIKNNTDYGRDITEKGKEFPREFLEGIYESIKEEEIRTEGEGADGCMTIERWKDVLRSTVDDGVDSMPSRHDAEDLTELVLEHVWIPIMSAIGAFWGIARSEDAMFDANPVGAQTKGSPQKGNMLGVQGARLGMDMAIEMLEGVLHLRRIDIFRRIFACVCKYTGLVGDYAISTIERTAIFTNSLEAQSGAVVAMHVARSASDDIGVEGWKLVWQMMFELRDLKLLGAGMDGDYRGKHVLRETEPDLLTREARRRFNKWLLRGDTSERPHKESSGVSSVLGAFGRVLFGGDEEDETDAGDEEPAIMNNALSPHGKEAFVVWDERAYSDDEEESEQGMGSVEDGVSALNSQVPRSIGAQFENDLIRENLFLSQQTEMTVTGLERVDETLSKHRSPRARVRNRLARGCDFHGLVSESRFMTVEGIQCMLQALCEIVEAQPGWDTESNNNSETDIIRHPSAEDLLDLKLPVPTAGHFPLSPASLTFAEVLICEIALKNKDRLGYIWDERLEKHYLTRTNKIAEGLTDRSETRKVIVSSSMEKCLTGLLRISACATNKDMADNILGVWSKLVPSGALPEHSMLGILDKHIGGGVWRIVNNVDGYSKINQAGWAGLFALITWCAARGGQLPPLDSGRLTGNATLAEDDPALQAYRSLHLMLNTEEVCDKVPYPIINSVEAVIGTGECRRCTQLSIAGLDLLHSFLERRGHQVLLAADSTVDAADAEVFCLECWKPSLQVMARTAGEAGSSNVRQHSLSMLTDTFLNKIGSSISGRHISIVLIDSCYPLIKKRISELRNGDANVHGVDELMIEYELCIKFIFKTYRHHVTRITSGDNKTNALALWKAVLASLEDLLADENAGPPPASPKGGKAVPTDLARTMCELATEHLKSAIMFLISEEYITASPDEFSTATWESIEKMRFCKQFSDEWKQAVPPPASN